MYICAVCVYNCNALRRLSKSSRCILVYPTYFLSLCIKFCMYACVYSRLFVAMSRYVGLSHGLINYTYRHQNKMLSSKNIYL
jgi:hypothetical protein